MKNKKKTIFIFTQSFPYFIGGENTFLQYEVEYIKNVFDEIVIFPANMLGEKQKISDKIEINSSIFNLISRNKHKSILNFTRAFFSKYFIKELFIDTKNFKSPIKLFSTLSYLSMAYAVSHLFHKILLQQTERKLILYTYWCTPITLGLAMASKSINFSKVITRAHGIDLYEERGGVYFRGQTIQLVDKFYLISEDGFKYLSIRYKKYIKKYELSRLGIKCKDIILKEKKDNIIRIVSCSNIDFNKQVQLIYESIYYYAQLSQSHNIEWHHFGDGPLKNTLEKLIVSKHLSNLKTILHGFQSNDKIINFYENNYIDLFINASISEGIPVSIMEAQSFGIPIVAPSIGGIPEIVNNKNGKLLSNTVSDIEIAKAINNLINQKSKISAFRENSRKSWEEFYNAERNYVEFSQEILKFAVKEL
jgi:glycosyltransferase involved in cell wall biosynthesis